MDNEFTTIYFKKEYEITDEEITDIEMRIGIGISKGDGFINAYTTNRITINGIIDWIGDEYIEEVSYP